MTSEEIREICNDRLGAWTKCLVEDHATPVILIGEGHDEELGKTVILLIKDESSRGEWVGIDDSTMIAF